MSRTPDYRLKVMDKNTGVKSRKLGCAWVNDDESITIQLDTFVSIAYIPGIVITLFPWAFEKDD